MKNNLRKLWTMNEDRLLKKYIKQYGPKWLLVAKAIGRNRNASQCSQRWKRIKEQAPKVHAPKYTRWNSEEDELLLSLKQKNMSWLQIKGYFTDRTTAQVKKRFENNVNPNINKNPFSPEEDKILEVYISQNGTKWTEISKNFNGRPENMLKNRYYFHLRQKLNSRVHPYYERQSTSKASTIKCQPDTPQKTEIDSQSFLPQIEDYDFQEFGIQNLEEEESTQYSFHNPFYSYRHHAAYIE